MAEGEAVIFLPGLLTDAHVYGGLNAATYDELQTIQAFYGATFEKPGDAKRLAEVAGIDYVVVTNRTPAGDKLQTIGAYYFDRLAPRVGSPELGTFGIPNAPQGWSLDPNSEERLAVRGTFAVPGDISSDDPSLNFSLVLSPIKPVEQDGNARLVIAYFELVTPGDEPEIVNVVFEAELKKGLRAGAVVRVARSPSTTVTPGATYGLVVARLGAAPEDTYTDDVALFGLFVYYRPSGLHEVERTAFNVLDVASR
jgi:hypothetical protein